MEIYIQAARSISPQETFQTNSVPEEVKEYVPYLKNILPDFRNHFPPVEQRRMNTLIKTALVCASETIKDAGISRPDIIITGTGLGCVADTEKFLHSILDSDEGLLTPTAFIQSTHNIIGALIALNLKCHGYNVLYAHKTVSFDHALLDALLQLNSSDISTALIGGFDEITEENFLLKQKIGLFTSLITNTGLAGSNVPGSVAGEGSSFFVLNKEKNSQSFARIRSVRIAASFHKQDEVYHWIQDFLKHAGLSLSDIDAVITGINGDRDNNRMYYDVLKYFGESSYIYYKHLCGEYDTASSFALWLGSIAIKHNGLPAHCFLTDRQRDFKNVLIYHQNDFSDHSLILLSEK